LDENGMYDVKSPNSYPIAMDLYTGERARNTPPVLN
jgi:hypothetical protein